VTRARTYSFRPKAEATESGLKAEPTKRRTQHVRT
jgi:hypothetical protein